MVGRRWIISSWVVMSIAAGVSRGGDVRFTVSSRETYAGVPIDLQVIIEDVHEHDPPDFPDVEGADVRFLGPSTQQFTSITPAGREVHSTVTYTYRVVPRRAGTLVIPSISVSADGETRTTEPTKILVHPSETGDLLHVELKSERESVYVGEPIDVTLEVWIKPYQSGGIRLSEFDMWRTVDRENSSWGPFIENLRRRQPDVSYRTETRKDEKGRLQRYFVYSLERRVWPERAGVFDADGVRVLVKYPLRVQRNRFMLLGGRYEITDARPVSAAVEDSSIVVKSPPQEGRPVDFNGAVGTYTMTVSAAPTEVSVGDPITVTLSIRGTGRLELLRAPRLGRQESLTADFRVPDEELAGVVEGGVKKFSQSIRAKHDRVTAIPPIEFSYFDPRSERYVTLKSDPIPITVKESSRLAVSEIAEGGGGLSGVRTELTLAERGLLANYDEVDLLLRQQSVTVGWGTSGVAGAGPALFAVSLLIRRRRDRLASDTGFARRRSARKTALAAIGRARDDTNGSSAAGDILTALTGYVADRCNLPAGSVTRSDAVNRLRAGGVPESLVDEVDGLLAECEGTQYGAVEHNSVNDFVERARRCVDQLEPRKFA